MNNQNIVYEYNGQVIEFNLQNKNVMVNATEMAKLFGKKVELFMKADHVKQFISAVNCPPFGGQLGINSEEDLVKNRKSAGLWMHRILALKFAAWLDPKFEVWVYCKIDEILFGDAIKRKDVLISKTEKQLRKEQLEASLRERYLQDPEYIELQKVKNEIKHNNNDLKYLDNQFIQLQMQLLENT